MAEKLVLGYSSAPKSAAVTHWSGDKHECHKLRLVAEVGHADALAETGTRSKVVYAQMGEHRTKPTQNKLAAEAIRQTLKAK